MTTHAFVLATDLVTLAAEDHFIPGEHIAARLAVPLGILFFCGSVYLLLWSIYGAKKGALVYGTAFFAFAGMMGVFWWFGAPGTPPGTGPTYLPGQPSDHYQGRWYPMEPGSERASLFDVTSRDLEELPPPEEYLGLEGASDEELEQHPGFRSLLGDISTAVDQILDLYLPETEAGTPLIGSERRSQMLERAGDPPGEDWKPASPFLSARAVPHPDDPNRTDARVTEEDGLRIVAVPVQVVATYELVTEDSLEREERVVEEATWFAFKDPGALWFPSALWTGISVLLFAGCLFGLDVVEQRERRGVVEREPVKV